MQHPGTIRLVVGLASLACSIAIAAEPRIDFGKQIRPILAERCYECHGPEKQEGKLRLDRRADARRGGDSGEIIAAGASRKSRLVDLITSANEDERMPLGKKPLLPDQIALLKRWIEEGADWPDAWSGEIALVKQTHWSFRPTRSPPLPVTTQSSQLQNQIDAFIAARLDRENLALSPEADRYTLVRRLYFDLIGLPPTPEEADEFVSDLRPGAFERLVDRLLASPQYGERWARRWLDLARYADTNGYEKDRPRSIWPFRDWVVRALNEDVPFDRFTIQQLAGDLLPQPSIDDRIATGFHRNTMLNEEGGIDPLEFRFHAMVDRTNTTGTVWLGLTVGCSQCHSHKFDPLLQSEYYQLMAFLNNCDEVETVVPDERVDDRRREIELQIAKLVADLPKRFEVKPEGNNADQPSLERRREELMQRKFEEWQRTESSVAANWAVLRPTEAKSNLPLLTLLPDDSVLASGDQTKSDTYDLRFQLKQDGVTAIRLEALPHESLPLGGPGRAYYEGPKGDFFLSEFRASVAGAALKFKSASHDYSKLSIGGGENGASLTFDGNTTTGWSTSGREGEPHSAVFNLAEPTDIDGGLSIQMVFERHFSCGLGRFRISVTTSPNSPSARGHTAEIEAILAKQADQRTPAERDRLFQRFLENVPELSAARAEIKKLRDSLPKRTTTLVMQERPIQNPRATNRHHRGEYLQPKEIVVPAVPAFLPPLKKNGQPDRLEFAEWLVSAENPLTPRVAANRQWQAFFGRGIVRTVEDFGIQGEPPSHPELLDWLAIELATGGTGDVATVRPEVAWSLKRFHRKIVTSATYRQSSRFTPDPQNVLLSRAPRVRLEAELIRDGALRAADLLSFKMGGPGVYPPQPETITTEGTYGALAWTPSPGEDRYRRGLYTYIKRTAPFAMYATFDAPSGEACLARREPSNSPLQALTLLNDVIFIEAAQSLGKHASTQANDDATKLTWLFRRTLTRPPTIEEINSLMAFATAQRARFANGELDPRKFTLGGDGDLVEQATWTVVARALLNLDETIVKR